MGLATECNLVKAAGSVFCALRGNPHTRVWVGAATPTALAQSLGASAILAAMSIATTSWHATLVPKTDVVSWQLDKGTSNQRSKAALGRPGMVVSYTDSAGDAPTHPLAGEDSNVRPLKPRRQGKPALDAGNWGATRSMSLTTPLQAGAA